MLQIIPENRRQSTREILGKALGQGLSSGVEAGLKLYGANQKKQQYSQALKGIEDIYSNPEMSQEQKFVKAFSALKDFPDAAKQFTTGMSQFSETPLQKAQRLKLEQEIESSKGEENYFNQFSKEGNESNGLNTPRGAPMAKFDANDPSTWSDKQINNFRAYEGKNAKGKSFAKNAQNEFERRKETKKASEKYQSDIAPLEGALGILDQMEKLGAKGNLGIGTSLRGVISPKTRREASEYERLGKSLISFASNIPIRNRQEFETLAHDLYDPSISDDSRKGILSAMKRIIQSSMQGIVAPEGEESYQSRESSPVPGNAPKERPPLTSFMR